LLNALTIENIAVAKLISTDFSEGFSVLTGGTGAGKSLLVDALGLLAGDKAPRELIRSGETKASVSGIFSALEPFISQLREAGVEVDDEGLLQITRSFTADGKSSVRINGRSATVALLKEIGTYLISINGQSDSHLLSDRSLYVHYLDEFGDLEEDLAVYRSVYEKLQEENAALRKLEEMLKEQHLLTDIYKGYLKEIDAAKLSDPEEEEKLEKLRQKIKSAEKISKHSSLVYRALAQNDKGASASYLLDRASAAIRQLSDVMEDAEELSGKLDDFRYEIEEIANRAAAVADDLDVKDPEKQLTAIESRLHLINRLEKKYGLTISDILTFRKETAEKLAVLSDAEIEIKEHTRARDSLYQKVTELSAGITEKRRVAGEMLTQEMQKTLLFLDMPKVEFFVSILPVKPHANGADEIQLMISANAGEPPQPIDKIASGGELARIMLALKCALAGKHGVGCVVFDEIDTGVSGGTSEKIGLKLKELSTAVQVICVTHSPQIAARADMHYLIEKNEIHGRTESFVRLLDDEGRVAEIARIIGGVSITDTQRDAAKDLLNH